MRIWTISDLHMRQRDALDLLKPDRFPEADLCVIAGDVCERINLAINWVGKVIRPRMPVIFVPGNHEFYESTLESTRRNAKMLCGALGVTLLDDAATTIDGIRFVGGTLWTDFKLNGAGNEEVDRAMDVARVSLADYGETRILDFDTYRQMKPQDTLDRHVATRAFLASEFENAPDMPTVVVTHHAPHRGSIHEKYASDPVTAAFVSDMAAEIECWHPLAWIHGHVHSSFDYNVGATRIVCNPKGYRLENPDFDFMKVIEIG
ncbi:metallophosphoesterase [Agrobacterium rubi]|nr:metallophosphoesterase [Agrobacterium rubi]NTF24892.1 metallophosphoesterase [Agrobacterium rubi]